MRKFPYFRDSREIKGGFRGTLDMVWGLVGADVVYYETTAHHFMADVRVFRRVAVIGDGIWIMGIWRCRDGGRRVLNAHTR